MRSQRHLREIQGFDSACRTAYELGERSRWTPQEQYDRARARGCNPPPPPNAKPPGVSIPMSVTGPGGATITNPPAAYPYLGAAYLFWDESNPPRPSPSTAKVILNGVVADPAAPVTENTVGFEFFVPVTFPAAGPYDIRIELDTGDWAERSHTMLPVATTTATAKPAPAPAPSPRAKT